MARTAAGETVRIEEKQTLYRALLGEAFDSLPNAMRRFHSELGRRTGVLTVERVRGLVRQWAAQVMRLPPPGENVPLILSVSSDGAIETWDRTFGDHFIRTRQWTKGGLLMEQAGPLQFAFRVTCDGQAMSFAQRHCWLLGMSLPRAIAPTISAVATGNDNGWHIHVVIALPLMGTITRYEGDIQCP